MNIRPLDDPTERLSLIRGILNYKADEFRGGEKFAIMALAAKETANVIAIFDDGVFKGAMSYRIEDGRIKRINTGVFPIGKGYGSSMVNYLREKYPNVPHWCLSIAPNWCEKLGMNFTKKTEDGRFHYEGFK